MDSNFIIRTCIFSSGERFPVLLHKNNLQPVLLPTRYVIDTRRETKQAGTIERDVRVIGWLYDWADEIGINLEDLLMQGKQLTQSEIIGFCRYLRTLRKHSVIGGIHLNKDSYVNVLSPNTFNVYTFIIQDFLIWASNSYIPAHIANNKVYETVQQAKERIRKIFKGNRIVGRNASRNGLTEEEIVSLRETIKPEFEGNPFKKSTRFRNYLIVELMLATGIRRGELLKLELKHLPQGAKHTLSIVRTSDDAKDPRKKEPKVKTLSREIPLSNGLMKDLWKYVQKFRKKGNHPFLFTSYRDGSPLDSGGVNWIFQFLVRKSLPSLKGRLHPHTMRHTFNNRLVLLAKEKQWDSNRVENMQKYLNGWSENSAMPQVYARRAIEAMAMELMEQYQDSLYQ